MGKSVLIFKDGLLYRQLMYNSKRLAKLHYGWYKKRGYLDETTGLVIEGLTYEIV